MKAMETHYMVMALMPDPGPIAMRDHKYEPYTGRCWDDDHILDAHEELWDAQHDGDVEDAYIMEVTA